MEGRFHFGDGFFDGWPGGPSTRLMDAEYASLLRNSGPRYPGAPADNGFFLKSVNTLYRMRSAATEAGSSLRCEPPNGGFEIPFGEPPLPPLPPHVSQIFELSDTAIEAEFRESERLRNFRI